MGRILISGLIICLTDKEPTDSDQATSSNSDNNGWSWGDIWKFLRLAEALGAYLHLHNTHYPQVSVL